MTNRTKIAPVLSSSCHEADGHRFELQRRWGPGPKGIFVMLNPSTADGVNDDPTIRKCRGFGQRWGWGGMVILNLYSYRATKPRDLWAALKEGEALHSFEDHFFKQSLDPFLGLVAPDTVVAWGNLPKSAYPRARRVLRILESRNLTPACIGHTGLGHPLHPLMPGYDNPRILFQGGPY